MPQRQRQQSQLCAASAHAFAGEKDEIESAGVLEVGELMHVKTIGIDYNRFAALQSPDVEQLSPVQATDLDKTQFATLVTVDDDDEQLHVTTTDLDAYVDKCFSEFLALYRRNNAPGALLQAGPNTVDPPKAASSLDYPALLSPSAPSSVADLADADTDSITSATGTSSGKCAHHGQAPCVPGKHALTAAALALANSFADALNVGKRAPRACLDPA
ncbi:MAG: hypothetical protein LQ347_005262, partial [Umbilicaria vellea]